jgi:quercetin dioxygenase-like cupin family protein
VEHTKAETLQWEAAPEENFTGPVWFALLSAAPDRPLNALGVKFDPGSRTDWHSHPEGQVLYVVSGEGRVGTDAGEVVEIGPGDVVHSPVGELHWHGATPQSAMVHLSLTTGGATVWTDRKVSDDDYMARENPSAR